jgi:hypothetical protein
MMTVSSSCSELFLVARDRDLNVVLIIPSVVTLLIFVLRYMVRRHRERILSNLVRRVLVTQILMSWKKLIRKKERK